MRQWGGTLFFLGIGSMVLYFLDMEFIVLAWVDMWGEEIGWIIRGAMAIVGGIMWLVGRNQEAEATA